MLSLAVLSGAALLAPAQSVCASVAGITVADASTGDYTLTSVTISRGAGTLNYVPSQLIGVDLTDIDAFRLPLLVPNNASLPAPGTRAALIEDGRLDTGVINVTTTNGTPDRSAELTFAKPVINSAGADILLFETGGDDGIRWWVNNDRDTRSADLATTAYSSTLLSGVPFTLFQYSNSAATDNILSLSDLESDTGFSFNANSSGIIKALELDLSTVGVAVGESVGSIRFQSLAGGGGRIDPVLVAALPAVPEPTGLSLMALAGMGAFSRRRRSVRRG